MFPWRIKVNEKTFTVTQGRRKRLATLVTNTGKEKKNERKTLRARRRDCDQALIAEEARVARLGIVDHGEGGEADEGVVRASNRDADHRDAEHERQGNMQRTDGDHEREPENDSGEAKTCTGLLEGLDERGKIKKEKKEKGLRGCWQHTARNIHSKATSANNDDNHSYNVAEGEVFPLLAKRGQAVARKLGERETRLQEHAGKGEDDGRQEVEGRDHNPSGDCNEMR